MANIEVRLHSPREQDLLFRQEGEAVVWNTNIDDNEKWRVYKGGCNIGMISLTYEDEFKTIREIKKGLDILNKRKGANRVAKLLAYKNLLTNTSGFHYNDVRNADEWSNMYIDLSELVKENYYQCLK